MPGASSIPDRPFPAEPSPDEATAAGEGLRATDFERIARRGIGDPANAYVHGMGYFEGKLYAGTTRHSMALLGLFPPLDPPAMDPWPVSVPEKVQDLDMQGQIWRYTPTTKEWELAYRSPMVDGKLGEPAPRDLGYRGMAVFQGTSDPKPALYVSTMSTVLRGTAAHVLRSYDGLEFEPVCEPGIGNPRISTFRELTVFDGHIYAPPAGEGVTFNNNRRSVVMRSADPRPGGWEEACESGFGDPTNTGIFMMTVFDGHLYAGTFNNFEGYQIWKTPPTGSDPLRWQKVIGRGAFRGAPSEIAMAMAPFNGALYVGSSIQNGGYDRYNLVGPASGEIIRIWPDDSWDLVVGTPRETPDGFKYPLSGLGPGFDNTFAGYMWRLCAHDGWLYMSTFDAAVFLNFAHRPSPSARKLADVYGIEQLNEVGGGFDLWRTRDGANWEPVTLNGMGNPYNYGGRTMVSTPEGLFLGTANPFGPESPARLASRVVYLENPDGGTEVWLGSADSRPPGGTTAGAPAEVAGPRSVGADVAAPRTCVAVTGGTGYIGRRLVQRLAAEGHAVRVLALPGTEAEVPVHPAVEPVTGGLDDTAALERLIDGADTVFHGAAILAGTGSRRALRRVNVDGTHSLLRVCAEAGALRRFVFSSSVAVYRHQFQDTEWPIAEASALRSDGGDDLADYGMTKIAGENLAAFYAKKGGFEWTALRFALVYGLRDPLADPMIRDMIYDPSVGLGPQADFPRQYVHVDDCVEALMRAGWTPAATGEAFNVAAAQISCYREMGRIVRRLAGWPTRDDLIPDRTLVWRRYVQQYDTSKARRLLGFTAGITIHEGIRQIVDDALSESPVLGAGRMPGPAAAEPAVPREESQ